MLLKKIIKNFFTANMEYVDSVSYRRVIMINSMLLLSAIVFYIFTYANVFIIQEYEIALLDFVSANAALLTLYMLRRTKNVKAAAFISIVIIILFMIIFILKNQNSHLGIIWSIFIPVMAISFNGKKIGLAFSIVFYAIMFYLAYHGIGTWNHGEWAFVDFLRFTIASSLLTYVIYSSESAHEDADAELKKVRKRELDMLENVKIQAITDGLTGMYNRRYFNEVVPKLLGIAQRDKSYVSLFILDVDYFKNYNDHYGHHKGDEVLRKIAQELINFIQRDDDFVFRIGGEEFAGIVHARNQDESAKWISEINKKILELNITHDTTRLDIKKVSVSIGICTRLVTPETDITYFYKAADKALYQAKELGRNRTIVHK